MSAGQLAVAAAIVVASVVIAAVLRRRSPDAPTQPSYTAPTQLDRADFPGPEVPWLVVVFSSATCHTCADVVAKAQVLSTPQVEVHEAEFTASRDLHRRYSIDAVPTLVVADAAGVVRHSVIGSVTATDLWAAVAECRNPGSVGRRGCG